MMRLKSDLVEIADSQLEITYKKPKLNGVKINQLQLFCVQKDIQENILKIVKLKI